MKKRFKKIYIEITNCCNRSCSFCPPTRRPPGFMSVTHFRHILREIRPWTDYIYLHVKGEPLLHPQLNQILAAAAGEKIYVNLTTNGTLLARQQETLLRYPIRQINISLHSFESGGTDAFNDYIHSAVSFARTFSPKHGITAFRLWNFPPEAKPALSCIGHSSGSNADSPENRRNGAGSANQLDNRCSGAGSAGQPDDHCSGAGSASQLNNRCSSAGSAGQLNDYCNGAGSADSNFSGSNERILNILAKAFDFQGRLSPELYTQNDARLAEKIFLSFDREFQWPSLDAPDLGAQGSCFGLKSHLAILWDGTVVPCCLDGDGILALGNIFTQSFEEILHSPKSCRIAEGFQKHTAVEALCRRCGYRTRFRVPETLR